MSSDRVNRPGMLSKKLPSSNRQRQQLDPSPKQASKKVVNPGSRISSRSDRQNTLIRNELQDSSFTTYSRPNKKVNMSHLLNFNSTPRNQQPNHKFQPKNPALPRQIRRPPINYVRTRCQTMLRSWTKSTPSIKQLNIDPNMYIEWDECISALKFFVNADSQHTCAICLSDVPIAPRSTRCGHLFCFPCILHHFSVIIDTNQTRKTASWHKCPICHKEILKRKLKPGRICFVQNELEADKTCHFSLVERQKGNIFANLEEKSGQSVSLLDCDDVSLEESQFTFVTLDHELKMLEEDLENLILGAKNAEETEKPFFKEAMEVTSAEIADLKKVVYTKERQVVQDVEDFLIDKIEGVDLGNRVQYYQSKNQRVFLHPLVHRF